VDGALHGGGAAGARRAAACARACAAKPEGRAAGRNDFRCGEKVAFEDKHLNTVVGVIVRINQRTASIDPGDGTTWRVGFSFAAARRRHLT
jgi:hypothetical protein